MRFLIDAQLPPALARELVARGHEAEHVADLGLASAPDRRIWEWRGAELEAERGKDRKPAGGGCAPRPS